MFGQTTSSFLLLLCQGLEEQSFPILSTLLSHPWEEGGGHRAYGQGRKQGTGLINSCRGHMPCRMLWVHPHI